MPLLPQAACVLNRHFMCSWGLSASRKARMARPVHPSAWLDIYTEPMTRVLCDTWGCISLALCLYRSRLLWWEETEVLSSHIWWIYIGAVQLWMQSHLVTSMLLETEHSFKQIPTDCHVEKNKRLLSVGLILMWNISVMLLTRQQCSSTQLKVSTECRHPAIEVSVKSVH